MPNDERALVLASTSRDDEQQQDPDQEENIRDIHALTPPRTRTWENSSHRSSNLSEGENFSSMSREFNALVNAGSTIANYNASENDVSGNNNLGRIGEEEMMMMMMDGNNPLAIVPDNNPLDDPVRGGGSGGNFGNVGNDLLLSVQRVKKEEVESKINAWQNAKVAKINNRFKREDAIISGWESEQVQKATSSMKKVERKLEEKRARALEKMQNDVAKAHRKAEERRASAEAKRGTKVAKILEICNLMRAVGRPPVKRSFF